MTLSFESRIYVITTHCVLVATIEYDSYCISKPPTMQLAAYLLLTGIYFGRRLAEFSYSLTIYVKISRMIH